MRVVQELAKTSRVQRRPTHPFHIRHMPFAICPFLIAPVLPGETMKNFLLQSRCVTDPIKNGLIGWWLEYYVFYVKHRQLSIGDALVDMMLDADKDMAAYRTATDRAYYHRGSAINFTKECLMVVVSEYFRDQGEAWNVATIGGYPAAKVNQDTWMDSLLDTSLMPVSTVPAGTDIDLTALDKARRMWELLVSQQLTNMTYEDYLRTFGVRTARINYERPELLRYVREWQYPSNTVDPTTGTPSSAVSWAVAERADKDRFFDEPGFIFGVTVARPKVYYKNQEGSAVNMLESARAWLPAILQDDPATSLLQIDNAAGPLKSITNDYWVDIRDLFVHGDQFTNYADTTTTVNFVALPEADLDRKYVVDADVDALFITADTAVYAKQDGVATLTILGSQKDMTPTGKPMIGG